MGPQVRGAGQPRPRSAEREIPLRGIQPLTLRLAGGKRCAEWLRKKLGSKVPVLGPAPSVLRREDGRSRYQILIKAKPGSRRELAKAIAELRRKFGSAKDTAELLTVDVNPYSFM